MVIDRSLQLKDGSELQKYCKTKLLDKKKCVSFYGSLQKHPSEEHRIVLVADPFSENTFYYEFNKKDILLAEEQPGITNPAGESVFMARIWVRKKCVALRCIPFIVETINL